jgi:proteic killer suppression protein
VKAFFRVMQMIADAIDERTLRGFKGLRMEKLHRPPHNQYSLRLNDRYRLIVQIEEDVDGSMYLLIIAIEDYH